MKLYQWHASHGKQGTGVVATHLCGHTLTYEYGGTHQEFEAPRSRFAAAQAERVCPDCRVLAELEPTAPPESDVPLLAAAGGLGRLTVRDGKTVFVTDEPVIVEGLWEDRLATRPSWGGGLPTTYTYATTVLGPYEASYLHARPDHVYTAQEQAWLNEYQIGSLIAHRGFVKGYAFGASLTSQSIFDESERRSGKRVYLTRRTPDGPDEDDRVARQEAYLEQACEDGQIPGAL